ncbi:MAG: hypothetical protein K9N22_09915 [Candidatus Marinimicrobia bacterium]|nr:hypothetical protein [Candidatus Neomarinimicrobiota bacterium]MCF7841078.1 hypothetical protein [Candidatus Neomarinimicrobiota bacterium]
MSVHQPKGGINRHQPVAWLWLIIGMIELMGATATLFSAEIKNTGTWYEEDTLYVLTVQVPDNQNLTSMKLQEKIGDRYSTVGSPRIQVIPADFIGKEIIFTRSRLLIGTEIGERSHVPEFRVVFYEEGLKLAGYTALRRVLKPSTDVDLEMISRSAYPVLPQEPVTNGEVDSRENLESSAIEETAETVTADTARATVLTNSDQDKIDPSNSVETPLASKLKPVVNSPDSVTAMQQTKPDTLAKSLTRQKPSKPAPQSKASEKQKSAETPDASVNQSKKREPRPKVPSKAPWGTIFNQGILNGLALEMSIASPYWVSENLNTWYSSVDWRFSFTMPFYYRWGSVMMGVSFEWSSYDFENTFPEGGRFMGQAKLAYVSTYWRGLILELGGGKFSDTTGFIAGISGKILEGEHLYLGGGMRGVVIQEIPSIGQGHWADGRLTLGYKF